MITITTALVGLSLSIVGIGILFFRHRNDLTAGNDHDPMAEMGKHNPLLFEEFFVTLKMHIILFWQTTLRHALLSGSEKILAWCERAFKRIAAFLRLLRSRLRRRQLNGSNQEDRYWHNLNSWNSRRLKLRLRRKKNSEEE